MARPVFATTVESYGTALIDVFYNLKLVGKGAPASGIHYDVSRDDSGRVTKVASFKGKTPTASFFLKGATVVEIKYGSGSYEWHFLNKKGEPFPAEGAPIWRLKLENGRALGLSYLDKDGKLMPDFDGVSEYMMKWEGDRLDILPLDTSAKVKNANHLRIAFYKNKTVIRVFVVDGRSKVVPDYEGIYTKEYTYDSNGLLRQVRFLDDKENKTINAYDVHAQMLRYDDKSRFLDVRLEGKTGNLIEVRDRL